MIKFSELNELSKGTLTRVSQVAKDKSKMATEFANSSDNKGDAEWHQNKAKTFDRIGKRAADKASMKEDVELSEGDWTHVLDADVKVDKEKFDHKNLVRRGTVLKKHHNDHYEVKAGPHKGKFLKLSKEHVVEESFYVGGVDNEISKEMQKVHDAQTKAFRKDQVTNAKEKANSPKPLKEEELDEGKSLPKHLTPAQAAAAKKKLADQDKAYAEWLAKQPKTHPDLVEGTDVKLAHKVGDTVWAKHPTSKATTLTGKVTKVGRTTTTIEHKNGTSGVYPHKDVSLDYPHKNPYRNESEEMTKVSFKEFISENVFDWKNKKSEIDWKDDKKEKEDSNVHKGTYGSETHKAKGDGSVAPKRGRGRPAGSYQGEYKKRDPGSKAASAAKAMASKAEGLKVRGEYKQAMNDAIKKRQLQLAGITK